MRARPLSSPARVTSPAANLEGSDMIRKWSVALAFGAVSLWAGSALAFEPISFAEMPSLVGKTIYAGANKPLGGKGWAYAGDALTVVAAEPFGKGFNYIKVRATDGTQGEIQIRYLSKAPLRYTLRKPGNPKALLKNLLEDGFPLGAKIHAIQSKHGYSIPQEAADDYHQADAMREALSFTKTILHAFVHGSNRSKSDLMREDETKWLAQGDDVLLDWYSDGMSDKATKANFEKGVNALNALDNTSHHGFEIARLSREKATKPWARGLDGIPADKRAKLDKEKTDEVDREIAERKKKLAAGFADAAKLKASVK